MSLLPPALWVKDPFALTLGPPQRAMATPVEAAPRYRPVCNDWACATASDGAPAKTRVLADWAVNAARNFDRYYSNLGCVCFTGCAPCSYCTHEGNPLNLEDDDEAWILIHDGDIPV